MDISSPNGARQREEGLERGLTRRQLTMIGIGGAIGTGLFMGSGLAIGYAGPGVLLSYLLAAVISLAVMFSLAEMAVLNPTAGSFGTHAELYISPLAGWIARWTYWAEMVILIGSEAVAVGHYLSFWVPALPVWLSILLSGGGILFVNMRAVGSFGTVEYWLSAIKVAAILAFILLGLGMVLGVGTPAIGLSNYMVDGGPLPFGLKGVWMGAMIAIFSFFGIEMIAVAAGEADDPGTAVPRAMRTLLVRLCLFYLLSIAIILAIVPWSSSGAAVVDQSPFVKVFAGFGIVGAASVMNFVVLCAALSAMNSSLYMASRMLFSLARAGDAPASFGVLNGAAVPARAALASGLGILIAAAVALLSPRAFEYMLGIALFGGLFTWMLILVTHFRFRRRVGTEGLAYRAPFFPIPQCIGLAGLLAIVAAMLFSGGIWRISVAIGVPWLLLVALIFLLRKAR
ncbi:amino acid permease [Sphingomonas sp. C8-2]|uniref:amino acid permease n=1 Tax=Rhizorhabdus histidinilytica TaxID=439228 RepID=UPI000F77E6E4|nr:amino acid permease [Sphingomonas sp. C8-2]